jgi:hypothetical protein
MATLKRPKTKKEPTPGSTSMHQYDIFDIDNVCLPNAMINLNYRLDMSVIRPREVPTPRWRVVHIDDTPEWCGEVKREEEEEESTLDDAVFLARHEAAELRWRYRNTIKWLNARRRRSTTKRNNSTTAACIVATDTRDMSVDELRGLMHHLETTELNHNNSNSNNHRRR